MLLSIVKKYLHVWLLLFFFLLTTFNFHNLNLNFFFKIKNVELNPTKFLDEITKSKAIDSMLNKNIFFVDKKELNKILYQNVWVKKVEFKKKFPNTILISITEYQPIAFYQSNEKIYIVNDSFQSEVSSNNLNIQSLIKLKNVKNLKDFKIFYYSIFNKYPFFSDIKEIHQIYDQRWNIIMNDKKIVKLGNYNLEKQFKNLSMFLNNKNIHVIDLRLEDRLVVSYAK